MATPLSPLRLPSKAKPFLGSMEFGRRAALERELDKSDAVTSTDAGQLFPKYLSLLSLPADASTSSILSSFPGSL